MISVVLRHVWGIPSRHPGSIGEGVVEHSHRGFIRPIRREAASPSTDVQRLWWAAIVLRCHRDGKGARGQLPGARGSGGTRPGPGAGDRRGGSLRCALVGDQLALVAQQNGWSGMVVYGCIRDSAAIAGIGIGLKAMNTNPRKSVKRGFGERDIAVSFAGVTFTPGAYLYADPEACWWRISA